MKTFLRDNGLSIFFLLLFLLSLFGGQLFTGMRVYNQDLIEQGRVPEALRA